MTWHFHSPFFLLVSLLWQAIQATTTFRSLQIPFWLCSLTEKLDRKYHCRRHTCKASTHDSKAVDEEAQQALEVAGSSCGIEMLRIVLVELVEVPLQHPWSQWSGFSACRKHLDYSA